MPQESSCTFSGLSRVLLMLASLCSLVSLPFFIFFSWTRCAHSQVQTHTGPGVYNYGKGAVPQVASHRGKWQRAKHLKSLVLYSVFKTIFVPDVVR